MITRADFASRLAVVLPSGIAAFGPRVVLQSWVDFHVQMPNPLVIDPTGEKG
jgi:hypothetical protein